MSLGPTVPPLVCVAMKVGGLLLVAAVGLASASEDSGGAAVRLYDEACAACHGADGGGIPRMQPALDGSPVVAGEPDVLVRLLLRGPAQTLPADRPLYSGEMPVFSSLTDEEIATVVTYIRRRFASRTTAITASVVRRLREE